MPCKQDRILSGKNRFGQVTFKTIVISTRISLHLFWSNLCQLASIFIGQVLTVQNIVKLISGGELILIIKLNIALRMSTLAKRNLKMSTLKANLKSIMTNNTMSAKITAKLEQRDACGQKAESETFQEKTEDGSDSSYHTPLSEDSPDGNSFFDRYTVQEKIGEGCNACVYRCVYKKTGRSYAVKKIPIEEEEVVILKKRFIQKRTFHHEAIVGYRALYFDEFMRVAFLVMEHLKEYQSLAEASITQEEELKRVAKGVLSALKYLHSQNVCHRDIKPDNIMVHKKSRAIKLIDLGISKKIYQRGTRRQMLTVIGNQLYLAPQMLLGGGYDERIDLWGLGISLFQAVTGVTPFQCEYSSETVKKIIEGNVTFDHKAWNRFSPFLSDFVAKLLKNVENRMTLEESSKHLWLQAEKPRRLRKLSSQVMILHEDFHQEMNTHMKNALSREQGEETKREYLQKGKFNTLASTYFDNNEVQTDEEDTPEKSTVIHSLKALSKPPFEGQL